MSSGLEMSRVTVLRTLAGALLAAILAATALAASSDPAAADFRLCNNTASRVGVAIGYKDGDGWTTEGWWNLPARTCETVVKGNLVARYYYVYAIDYDRGGEWMGQAYMCTRDKEFTIRGIGDCLARGYDRTGFFEVDTGEQRAWTVQLTESSEQPSQKPPPATGPVSANPPAATSPAAASPSAGAPAAASPPTTVPAADIPGSSAASPSPSAPSGVQAQ
jgi:uncharacterized membrane protein